MGVGTSEPYERDGFLRVSSRLSPSQIESLRVECRRVTEKARRVAEPDGRYSIAIANEPGDSAPEIVASFAEIAADLLDAEVESTFVLWHAVTAHLEDGRGWHQALAYYNLPYSPNGVSVPLDELEFLVMLDDASDDDMAPWFAPGLHVAPMLEHRRSTTAQTGFELIDPDRQLRMDEAVVVPLGPGDAVAYTLGTPHACVCAKAGRGDEVLFMRLGFRGVSS